MRILPHKVQYLFNLYSVIIQFLKVVSKLEELTQHAYNLLCNDTTHPCILFIDAINQFDDEKQQFLSRWLPEQLSSNVRVVVSMIEGTAAHQVKNFNHF